MTFETKKRQEIFMPANEADAVLQLKALRETGLSTREIQRQLGLRSQETVRRWLRGESNPQAEMRGKIAELGKAHGIILVPASNNPV